MKRNCEGKLNTGEYFRFHGYDFDIKNNPENYLIMSPMLQKIEF